jgi:hypothetical protein
VIIAANPEANGYYGNALAATTGSRFLVGSYNAAAGKGYVESLGAAQAGSPQQTALFAPLPAGELRIGYGVARLGEQALVNGKTASYLLNRVGAVWQQSKVLMPSAAGALVIRGALLAGDYALVQSSLSTQFYVDIYGVSASHISCANASIQLTAGFGESMSTNGQYVAIGTPGDSGTGVGSGVCTFSIAGAACLKSPACLPLPNTNKSSEGFGKAVAMSGSRLVVGAHLQSSSPLQPFFAYEYSGTAWTVAAQPPTFAGDLTAQWGRTLALDGDLLAVGAPAADSSKGLVRIYQVRGGQWSLLTELSVPAGTVSNTKFDGALFGTAVAVAGDVVAVGAPGATVGGMAAAGAVVLYRCPAL